MISENARRFIETWGTMGVLWGINRSMARAHALILVSDEPVDLDTVSVELKISRGNASMCLKELRNWGVIKRHHMAGDRRDFYIAEADTWTMGFRIASERKRREFDPALFALQRLLSDNTEGFSKETLARLSELEQTITTLDGIATRILKDEKTVKAFLSFVSNFFSKTPGA